MRIGFYQFNPKPKAVAENLNRIVKRLEVVKADIIVLPELCLTGYLFSSRAELARFAEPVPDGPTCSLLLNFCTRQNINLILGIAERSGSRIFNSAILVTTSGTVHTYRKIHLFTEEKDIFDQGNLPFPVFTLGQVRVGMLVCFDYFFPESSRTLALRGAQLICHPANLVLDYAQSMTITRAQENRIFWVLANRIGSERLGNKEMKFTGRSQIVAPDGNVLVRASAAQEELPIVDINPALALNKNVTPRNNIFTDRRPELYL
jgi:predicted amidohydrolase